MVATSRGFLNPPPSLPSTMRPSTPASTAFKAAESVGTTWKTVKPAAFSCAVYFVGLPADVVTNVTPCSITKSAIAGSRTKACAILTPNGLSVRVRIFFISSLMTSSSPELVSIMPMPPALETAAASCDRAIHPIGACTIGVSTPSISVTRFLKVMPNPFLVSQCSDDNCRRDSSQNVECLLS